jgi:hypothetical protein
MYDTTYFYSTFQTSTKKNTLRSTLPCKIFINLNFAFKIQGLKSSGYSYEVIIKFRKSLKNLG